MSKLTTRELLMYGGLVLLAMLIVKSWDAIVSFLGIVFAAIVPLMLGAAIAYVVAIPTAFIERHMLPNSTSKLVEGARRPLSLIIAVLLVLVGIALATSVFVPAFIETIVMVQSRSQAFIETVLAMPIMEPFRDSIHEFMDGDLIQKLTKMDVMGLAKTALGGTVGSVGAQVFGVVSTLMTGFFGLLFSLILLTDTTDVWTRLMEIMLTYLGPRRTEHMALVLGVADSSFHNFIVRQCLEALILGSVGICVLLVARYDYALGVGVLMGLSALVPIVGYPVGLLGGAFMIAISNPWIALIYIVVVAAAQMLEANLLLPHIGDPRTVLPPVWTTVGVTIGGGVAGFVGMLVAIPTAATIRQLVIIDSRRRQEARETEGKQT